MYLEFTKKKKKKKITSIVNYDNANKTIVIIIFI